RATRMVVFTLRRGIVFADDVEPEKLPRQFFGFWLVKDYNEPPGTADQSWPRFCYSEFGEGLQRCLHWPRRKADWPPNTRRNWSAQESSTSQTMKTSLPTSTPKLRNSLGCRADKH